MSMIIGYVFPINLKHANSIFEGGKEVFAKFGGKMLKLENGMKALFYVSGKKFLIGEAKIERIERMLPEQAWEKYGEKLFLTKKELSDYAKKSPLGDKRKTRELNLYLLTKIKKYKQPILTKRRMTIAGYYITKEEYRSL